MIIDILGNYAVKIAFFAALKDETDIDKIVANRDDEGHPVYDVEFSVNGVQLDFQKFINRMVNSYSAEVRSDAQNLLEERISEVMSKLQEMTDYASDILEGRR